MSEPIDPLETAILARLLVRSRKPPSERDVVKSVAALFGAAATSERIRQALDQLASAGMRATGEMSLTEQGRRRAIEILELSARDVPARWPALRARLAELALGERGRGRPMTASAIRAAALSAKLGLPGATPSEILDALAARELGMPGKRLTMANVRAHVLSRALGIDSLRDPKRIGAYATAKILDVPRTDAASVRDAVLRDWLGSPPPKKTIKEAPSELDAFATVVKELARANVEGRFGRHKVFIAPLWARARTEATLGRLSETEFKAKLVDAHRAGLLRLSRADLTPAMAPEIVAASEVPYLNAVFHFVDLEGSLS